MTNSTATNLTLTFVMNSENVSHYDDTVVVLGDELIMTRFCVTACGTEIFAINASDLAVADSWIAQGDIIPTRITDRGTKAITVCIGCGYDASNCPCDIAGYQDASVCPQCGGDAEADDTMCHTCGFDLVEIDEGNDPYGQFDGTEQTGETEMNNLMSNVEDMMHNFANKMISDLDSGVIEHTPEVQALFDYNDACLIALVTEDGYDEDNFTNKLIMDHDCDTMPVAYIDFAAEMLS